MEKNVCMLYKEIRSISNDIAIKASSSSTALNCVDLAKVECDSNFKSCVETLTEIVDELTEVSRVMDTVSKVLDVKCIPYFDLAKFRDLTM